MYLKKIPFLSFLLLVYIGCNTTDNTNDLPIDNEMYFPPIDNNTWETTALSDLNWSTDKADELYNYLQLKKTKGFIILKNGKIVIEKYFNGHSQNKKWTWFSAAKSLTATAIGIAQDEGILNMNNKTSDYLGENWSVLPTNKQDLITVKHHLSMSTGLKDNVGDAVPWMCTWPICIEYTADAGTRWAYHQGAFILLQDMLTQNTGMNFSTYIKEKISDKIGMQGTWSKATFLNIYSSDTRSMAKFGLLALNKGTWNNETIVSKGYFSKMVNTSQNMNKAYGYLWWLNGKESFMDTGSQNLISGSLIPNAPNDMFAALGAQDQKIYVIPSKNMVVVRCGESAGNENLGLSSFDNELWEKINALVD